MTHDYFVLSRGLTFHKLIVLYYTCSTRRCLVEVNWKALQDVFYYIYPQDLKQLINAMDDFIAVNGVNFHHKLNENQFFEKYMVSFFHMMLDPVEEGYIVKSLLSSQKRSMKRKHRRKKISCTKHQTSKRGKRIYSGSI